MKRLGFDCGTFNLCVAKRQDDGSIGVNKEINAFITMETENKFVFNMMKANNVPLVDLGDKAYVMGEAAINMSYAINTIPLKRPMAHGCVNSKEKDAFEIMSIMIHGLVGQIEENKTILYYSVPSNAVNQETDADYHGKVLQSIFNAYESDKGLKLDARPINEALAVVYAELASKAYTGFGISCGGGMVNVCYAMYGAPIFSFAVVNSGDWIDRQAAAATGETITFINREKMKVDLAQEPKTAVERAIKAQYQIMIEKTIAGIKEGLEKSAKSVRSENPIDVVVAGGTSMAKGFHKIFETALKQQELPIKIGDVIQPADPLYSVVKGCLLAAENAG